MKFHEIPWGFMNFMTAELVPTLARTPGIAAGANVFEGSRVSAKLVITSQQKIMTFHDILWNCMGFYEILEISWGP